MKSLTFLEEEMESNYPNHFKDLRNDSIDIQEDFENHSAQQNALVDNLFETMCADRNATLLTPKNHNVFVQDTPVEYYGLSMIERRKRGLDC